MKKNKKIIYYNDELNDDFASTRDMINVKKIGSDYKYGHGKLGKILYFFIYRLFATPVVWIYSKVVFGLKVKNKKHIKKLNGACFLYGNHTNPTLDAFIPTIISFPKRASIIVADDTVSIPIIKHLVHYLGALPLPSTIKGTKKFNERLCELSKGNNTITIYPEAHIWPYYNGIRNFSDSSFAYPVKNNTAVIGFTITYRQRKLFKSLPPLATVTLSAPFYPDEALTARNNKRLLRDKVHCFMCDTVKKENSYEYIAYRKAH